MRAIQDEQGQSWQVVAVESAGFHGKAGATLAFQPAGDPSAEPLLTPIVFNSNEAAEFAITTMSAKELRRRLSMARAAAGLR